MTRARQTNAIMKRPLLPRIQAPAAAGGAAVFSLGTTLGVAATVATATVCAVVVVMMVTAQPTVIHLRQADFATGTFRMRTPHRHYILDEDIEFNPTGTRSDIPIAGWFAVISIEADDIKIDLNGKTIQAAQEYLDAHVFFVFALIEMTNSPFPGNLFGLIGANYVGDTEFIAANNVEIWNGNLLRSSHWNLHGNNNGNIYVHDVHLGDFEVAAIQVNGGVDMTFRDLLITGIEHTASVSGEKVVAQTHLQYLQYLESIDYPGAAAHVTALSAFIDARPDMFNQTSPVPTNSVYGMFFTAGFPSLLPFPLSPALCAVGASLSSGRTIEGLVIENVVIRELANAPPSFPVIGSLANLGFAFQPSLLALPVAGAPRWLDAFDEVGAFAPNPYLLAAVFIINSQVELNPELTAALPSNYADIADSIVTGNVTKFLANTFPILGVGIEGLGNAGSFGVRLDCSLGARVTNVTVDGIHNRGVRALELSQIPYGNLYNSSTYEARYAGNDAWGFEFASNTDDVYEDLVATNITSVWGDTFGFDLAESVNATTVRNCNNTNIVAISEANTTSIVNPPPIAYGMRTKNAIGAVEFYDCHNVDIEAKRNAFGVSTDNSVDISYYRVVATNVTATTSTDMDSTDRPAEAFGFYQTDSNNTLFECVTAQYISLTGTNDSYPVTARATGIQLEGGYDTIINSPTISGISVGASGGTAANIHDDATDTVLLELACS